MSECGGPRRTESALANLQAFAPGIAESTAQWFAAYTAPRHEKQVHRHLLRRSIESYLPLYLGAHRWKNGCVVEVELPLFPNYVFVRICGTERVHVLEVPGLVSIVGNGRKPSPLPDFEIESLRSGLLRRRFAPHPYLSAGEKVRIKTGALAGLEGVLVRRKSNFRVVLSLEMIMQSVAVEVDAAEIEPAGKREVRAVSCNTGKIPQSWHTVVNRVAQGFSPAIRDARLKRL